jgi:ABC-type polysaccharide/polyol phosphate export permease
MESSRKSAHLIYDESPLRLAIINEAMELYRYRGLLGRRFHRDRAIRYKRSTLGFLCTMLNSLPMMLVLTMVFSNLFRFQTGDYPVYLLSGTLLYGFFRRGTSQAIQNIPWGRELKGKIYRPNTISVAADVLVSLVNLLLALIPLAIAMIVGHCPFSPALLFLPASIALFFIFDLGIGLFIASLAVFFADIADIYSMALTILTYLTPIFYPGNVTPDKHRSLIFMNPMYYLVGIFRQPIRGEVLPEGSPILRALLTALGESIAGRWFFTKKPYELTYCV